MIIQSKLSNEELLNYIYAATREYKKLLGRSFLLIGKNKKTDYYWFECSFRKKYFMHLLGIKSKTYTAEEFFDICIDYIEGKGNGITIKDCTPSRNHNRTTVNEKVSVCAEILRIENAKYFKIGSKDKISQYVDFAYAYGTNAILGFEREKENSSFPITLIPKSIDTFSTKRYKVLFVLSRKISDEKFTKLYTTIKENLFEELYMEFPEKLKNRILFPLI